MIETFLDSGLNVYIFSYLGNILICLTRFDFNILKINIIKT